MTIQEAMKLTDKELIALGREELQKWSTAYVHFQSTREFALRCKELINQAEG